MGLSPCKCGRGYCQCAPTPCSLYAQLLAHMALKHWPLTIMTTLTNILQLFMPLVLVRIFSAEDMGAYKIFFLYVQLFPLLALTAGFIHGVSFWSGDPKKRTAMLSQAWTILLTLNFSLCIVVVAALPWAKSLFFGSAWIALYFVLSGAFFIIVGFYEEVWVANGKVWRTAIFRSGTEVLRSGLCIVVAWYYKRIDLVMLTHTLMMLLRFVVATMIFRRDGLMSFAWERLRVREIWRYALPVSIAGILYAVSNSADQILLSRLLPLEDFALFSLGCIMVPPLFAMEQSVNQVLVAKVAQLSASNERERAQPLIAFGIKELAGFMIPSCVGLIVFAEPIIRIIYTDAYLGSVPILRVFAFRYILSAFPYDVGPKATGDGRWGLRVFIKKTLISLVLTPLLTLYGGPRGAIIGVLVSDLFLRVSGLWFYVQRFGWRLTDFVPFRDLGAQVIIAAVLGLLCWEVRGLFNDSRVWLLCAGSLFSVVYGGLVLLPIFRSRKSLQ